jgi:gamma-glutamyltranspeptidase/glutathione hydrolase
MLRRCLILMLLVFSVSSPSWDRSMHAQDRIPSPSPDAGLYPEPVDEPRWFPPATLHEKAMVSAAHPLAARAGADILKAGGNAVDAMVATQMVLNVVEPQSSGIGGGCFILFYDAKERKTYCIDGREECPAAARREDFLRPDGKEKPDALTGGLPVGVPGTVAAMWLAHERWGKLPIGRVLEPAIKLAEEGIGVTARLRTMILVNRQRFLRLPTSRAVFLHRDGGVPELGEVLKQSDLARTFRLLVEHGPRVFYEGEIARDIVSTVREAAFQPGRLAREDLQQYRAVYREPVKFHYRGYDVVSMPPPSSGGITVGMILGMLEGSDFAKHKPESVGEIGLLARTSAAAFADRNAYLGDQDWSPELDLRALLEPERIRQRAEAAWVHEAGRQFRPGPRPDRRMGQGLNRSRPVGPLAERVDYAGNPHEGDNTTHFSIVDGERNVVACTTTIEHGMGSGLVVAGRGFLLNNELTDFDLGKELSPNALDPSRLPRSSALTENKDPAGKRPRSSMTPVIVFKEGRPYLTLGSPGGSQIINIVAQCLVNVIDHGMDMQQAINAPRLSSQNRPLTLEGHYKNRAALLAALKHAGWRVQESQAGYQAWGGAHGIRICPDGKLEGGADPRREGAVRGY